MSSSSPPPLRPQRIAPRWTIRGSLVMWGAALYGTLSLSRLEWSAGNVLCGPWGCFPPLPAVLACHASWLVVLLPAGWFLSRSLAPRWSRSLNWGMIALGLAGLAFASWWAGSEWLRLTNGNRRYLVRHLLLELASTVDYPLLELIAVGVVGLIRCRRIPATDSPPPQPA